MRGAEIGYLLWGRFKAAFVFYRVVRLKRNKYNDDEVLEHTLNVHMSKGCAEESGDAEVGRM